MMRSWTLALALVWGLSALSGLATPQLAVAQDTPTANAGADTADADSDRAQSFRAMTGPATEDVPGGVLLIGAYGLVWIFVLLLVLRIGSVSRQVTVDLARLERVLADSEEG
jgi:hypothetical protein